MFIVLDPSPDRFVLAWNRLQGQSEQMRFQPTQKSRMDAVVSSGKNILIAYVPTSDPLIAPSLVDVYCRSGVNILEMGIRSDNPYLDGEAVRASMKRSTGSGSVHDARAVLDRLEATDCDAAAVIFAYASRHLLPSGKADIPSEQMRWDWKGIDGLLCLPENDTDAKDAIEQDAVEAGVKIVALVPYHFDESHVERARNASSYVMLQACEGSTGIRSGFDRTCGQRLKQLRNAGVTAPIVLGIGISTPEQCRQAIDCGADGVVVGSRALLEGLKGAKALEDYLRSIRETLDA